MDNTRKYVFTLYDEGHTMVVACVSRPMVYNTVRKICEMAGRVQPFDSAAEMWESFNTTRAKRAHVGTVYFKDRTSEECQEVTSIYVDITVIAQNLLFNDYEAIKELQTD